jgi:uncharacterized protein YjiS (DUF1127 family)
VDGARSAVRTSPASNATSHMASSTIADRALAVERHRSRTHLLAPAAGAIERLIAWIRREYRIRRGINELRSLDDYMLSDIGLTRDAIEHAARYGRLPRQWMTTSAVRSGRAGQF